jgi:hypothetical protein
LFLPVLTLTGQAEDREGFCHGNNSRECCNDGVDNSKVQRPAEKQEGETHLKTDVSVSSEGEVDEEEGSK